MCVCNKILVSVIVLILLPQNLLGHPRGHPDNFVPRIVGGYKCDTTQLPFFVLIVHRSQCGGSLLTKEWILTASHCLLSHLLEGVIARVVSGFDLSPALLQTRYIKEVYQHPNFNESEFVPGNDFRYDIGLILLVEPFAQTSAIHVGTLPAPGFTKHCSQVMTAGFGLTSSEEDFTKKLVRPLLCVNLTIVNRCDDSFPDTIFDDNIICAYAEGKDTCQGDSGGPLLCDNVIIGITSFGPTPCGDTRPGTYTMVEKFYDFINPIVKFTEISVKYARVNDTSDGDKKSNGTSGGDKRANGTSGDDKKVKKTRSSNVVQAQVANWKLIFISFLYYFIALTQ